MKRKKCVFSNTIVITIAVLTLFPIVFMFLGSFMGYDEVITNYSGIYDGNGAGEYAILKILPDNLSFWQYYKVLLSTPEFLYKFFNSVMISGTVLIGITIVATLGGYGFAKFDFPFKNILFFLFIIVMMLPYQVTLVPNFIMLNNMGLIDNRLALIIPNIFTPFGVFLIYQFMRKIPNETIEAARIDGVGEIKVLAKIVIPQAMPGITSLAVLNIIDTWSMIEQPLVFLRDENKYPLSLALSFINKSDIGIAFVCGVIFLIPLMLVFLIGKDNLIDGMSNSVI